MSEDKSEKYEILTVKIRSVWASDMTVTKQKKSKAKVAMVETSNEVLAKDVNADGDEEEYEEIDKSRLGFILAWSAAGVGFGELTIYQDADGKLHADTECMSRGFCAAVLAKFAATMELHHQ